MPTATPMSTVMPLTHAGSCTSILTPSHPHTWACTGHACKYICGTRGCVQPLPCGQLQRMTALIPCLSYPALPCLAPHASVMVDTIRVPPGPHVSCYVTHSHTARSRQWVLCVKDQLRSHHVDVWTEVRCSPPLPSPPLPSPPFHSTPLLPPSPSLCVAPGTHGLCGSCWAHSLRGNCGNSACTMCAPLLLGGDIHQPWALGHAGGRGASVSVPRAAH